MKLSARTIQILKNFTLVNQSLWFKQGKVIKTASPVKTIMAIADVEEDFDAEEAWDAIKNHPHHIHVGSLQFFQSKVVNFLTGNCTLLRCVHSGIFVDCIYH